METWNFGLVILVDFFPTWSMGSQLVSVVSNPHLYAIEAIS